MATPGAGVVLPAGSFSADGGAKALLGATGRALLEAVCGALTKAGVAPILVVLPHDAPEVAEALPEECMPVPNPTPELGEASSLALGLEAALQIGKSWALVALVDQPAVTAGTTRLIADRAAEEPGAVHVPTYNGERGHPSAVPTALAPSLFEAHEGEGSREVFSRLGILVREHPVDDPAIVSHVDSGGEVRRSRSRK
ncbi:MAG: NTP transferase domain-containing protein [Myxococcales bacterium]